MIKQIVHHQIPRAILHAKDAKANCVTFPASAKYLAYVADGAVVGVAAMKQRRNSTLFLASYVLPEYRKSGIYTALLSARIGMSSRPVYAHSTKHSERVLIRAGFQTLHQFKTNKKLILR